MKLINRKKIAKVVAGTTATAALVTGFGISFGNAGTVNAASFSELTDALNSYKTILENIEVSDRYGYSSFSIDDLNGDGMPDLICDEDCDPKTLNDFYTFKDGKAVKLDSSKMDIPAYGNYLISKDKGDFCWFLYKSSLTEGNIHSYVEFEIKGNSIVVKNHYKGTEKTDGTWDCSNDSGKISREEFDTFAASYSSVDVYQNNESNRVVQCKPEKYIDKLYKWKSNDGKWWVEDASGNYPTSQWLQLDGNWYYFDSTGYMAASEWAGGWWINADGTCTYSGVASWNSDSQGWWYGDTTGWYASNQWQKIDGNWYYFDMSGYMVTNQYVGDWWCGADGICK